MTLCKFFDTVLIIVTWAFSGRMFTNMNIICLTPVHASFRERGCVGKCVMSYFKHFSSTTNAMFLHGSHKKCSLLWAFFLPPPLFSLFPSPLPSLHFLSSFSLSPFFSSFLSLLFSLPFFLCPLFIVFFLSSVLLFSLSYFSPPFSPLSSFFPLSSFSSLSFSATFFSLSSVHQDH